MARRLKLTDTVIKHLCAAISVGATEEIACGYAGISQVSYYNWRKKGEEIARLEESKPDIVLTKEQKLFLKLLNKTNDARSFAAIGWLDVIANAARSDPAWARFMLKVRHPEGYSEIARHELTGRDGGPIETTIREVIVELPTSVANKDTRIDDESVES